MNVIEDNTTNSTLGGYFCGDDGLFYENPNTDFGSWDFHPNQPEPPPFTYSTYIENLRVTLNTMMKKQIKAPFQTNFKKAVIQVNRNQNEAGQPFDSYFQSKLLTAEQRT